MIHYDQSFLAQIKNLSQKFLSIAQSNQTPLYLYDPVRTQQNLKQLKKSFQNHNLDTSIFFAAKSNPYLGLLKTVVEAGEGIDVSSQRELKLALAAGAKKIIYTGPAKTEADFAQILQTAPQTVIYLESLRELNTLNNLAKQKNLVINCAVRIYTDSQLGWNKFGIPLSDLLNFCDEAKNCRHINLSGIHFHISMNKNAKAYVQTIHAIADYCETNFSAEERNKFSFVDIGGGFSPDECEALYSWNPDQQFLYYPAKSPLKKILNDEYQPRTIANNPSQPITKIAAEISIAFNQRLRKILPNIELYAEPGRFICHDVMHILLRLVDLKSKNIGVTDGGTNMIGWEKYQFSAYSPIFNLSQFTTEREIPFLTYGSLCTPDDIWGYYLYTAGEPQEGDVLCLPFQGAYTYTLAQNFIKDIPPVIDLDSLA